MANLKEPKNQILLALMSVLLGVMMWRYLGAPIILGLACAAFFFLVVNVIFFCIVSPRRAHKAQ